MRDKLGRHLTPIVVGEAQFRTRLAYEFDQFTLIDSAPFMKAIKRRSFDDSKAGRVWVEKSTAPGEGLEDLIKRS
jgi:hypothetical protein